MKLADLNASVDEATPNFEIEIERKTKGSKPVVAVFRNILRLTEEKRAKLIDLKTQDFNGADALSARAEAEKAALTLLVENVDHIEEIEKMFSQTPDDRDILWIQLSRAYDEGTQSGEASPSQEL